MEASEHDLWWRTHIQPLIPWLHISSRIQTIIHFTLMTTSVEIQ
jgi:hypothetical protein